MFLCIQNSYKFTVVAAKFGAMNLTVHNMLRPGNSSSAGPTL